MINSTIQASPVSSLVSRDIKGVTCGPHHTIAWSAAQNPSIGTRLPFCLNVSVETVEKLAGLLSLVCDNITSEGWLNPTKEEICLIMSCVQLLTLQLHAAVLEGPDSGLVLPSRLLTALKDRVVFLATDTCVNTDIQACAQNTLQCGELRLIPQSLP